jgi:hypothetical protein
MSRRFLLAGAGVLGMTLQAAPARAGGEEMCRVVDVEMTPTEDLQMVIWLEDSAGEYVETLFITELTGRRGLGNRPGRMDFNTAWRWPYGRREGTFPVWAHRHGYVFPRLVFQNYVWPDGHNEEDDLSHPFGQSSPEAFYCRPLREGEVMWDTQTCASMVYTDKGLTSATEDSLYPPRADIAYDEGVDDPSVAEFDEINPFDAVTQATPVGGVPMDLSWSIPTDLPPGDYVMWIEASKELDHNGTYNPTTYPEPDGILYGDYGIPYRGQPSVLYRIPFAIGLAESIATATDYVGYGDPDGLDGDIRPPDDSIDRDVPGSGAQRLLTMIDGSDSFRARVTARLEFDDLPPSAPEDGRVVEVTSSTATIRFVEPGDDGLIGAVDGYEVRYRAGTPITEADFLDATPAQVSMTPEEGGFVQELTIGQLLPQTTYYVAVRAYDDCKNYGPLGVIELTTSERETGEVDACFVATAAYGSLLANDVEMLRQVRDGVLRTNVAGELLVEAYYTFGPALAGLIGESEELRGLARDVLDPLVDWVKELSFTEPAEL